MMTLNSLLLSSEAPKRLVDFYRKILALEPKWQEGEYSGFEVGAGTLVIGPHSKVRGPSPNPERVIFNFETREVESEFGRMRSQGAAVIAEPYHPGDERDHWIATLADPDGNYFQLISPMS